MTMTWEEYARRTKLLWEIQRLEAERILAKHGIAWPPCSFEIGLGWMPHVEKAIDEMVTVGWNKQLAQVKQKFCGLQIYLDGPMQDDVIYDKLQEIISRAEVICDKICENCGAEHGLKVPRSGHALCTKCTEMEHPDVVSALLPEDPVMK